MVSFYLNKSTVVENKQGSCEIVNIREYRPLQKHTDSDKKDIKQYPADPLRKYHLDVQNKCFLN